MTHFARGALAAGLVLSGCLRAPAHFDLRALGFADSVHRVCVMPAVRAHKPLELFDDSSLTQTAIDRLAALFQASSGCGREETGRVEVWVLAAPLEAGLQVTLGVRGVGEQGVLWQREFVSRAAGVDRGQAMEALAKGLEEARRFVTLDASAGRVFSLPEASLRTRVVTWFSRRGLALSAEQDHVLSSPPRQLESDRDGPRVLDEEADDPGPGARVTPDGGTPRLAQRLRVILTPIDARQTMLEVFLVDARGGAVRERQSEVRLAELFDTEASLELLGSAEADVEPLGDFTSELTVPEVPLDDRTREALEKSCEVRLATLADLSPGRVLLLPDLEGSKETAQVVQRTLCAALSLGRHVTLALDVDASEQASLNAYLSSPGEAADQARLLAGDFWKRLWQDGRSSQALLKLLGAVRAMRQQQQNVTVMAMDAPFPGNPRMARMSARILAHHDAFPARLIIGYVSNTAARLEIGAEWNTGLLPLGYRLVAAGLAVSAFDLRYTSGARWTCRLFSQGHLRCGTWPVSPSIEAIDYDFVHSTSIFRHADGDGGPFTGSVCIGKVSPSRPAVRNFADEGQGFVSRVR